MQADKAVVSLIISTLTIRALAKPCFHDSELSLAIRTLKDGDFSLEKKPIFQSYILATTEEKSSMSTKRTTEGAISPLSLIPWQTSLN